MMKNNNGFTLVELLAILVILGVIAGIAIINISKQTSVSEKQGQTVCLQIHQYGQREEGP